MTPITLGFVPLLDAAPLIVARELGFAEEEGLDLTLIRAASWSQCRDMLDAGAIEAAHMLSAMPVARALGLGGGSGALDVLMVLSIGGQVIGLSRDLATRISAGFGDAAGLGRELKGRLRFGVPFPFSMHALLLRYWASRAAPGLEIEIVTLPPPKVSTALAEGEIDGFCIGEPWGTEAVAESGARIVLTGSQIWSQSPEKVLAARKGWGEEAGPLLRALWRAGQWAEASANRATLAEILARAEYLDTSALHIEPALMGRVGDQKVEQLLQFHDGTANFPWRSQAGWIGAELARAHGLEMGDAMARARATFRSDLYRRHLSGLAPLPRASDKVEGALMRDESLPAVQGKLRLLRNRFFDGKTFEPLG
jgi:NitT/TauT family transport system ATP-binding protein